jgi:hypothetical protein
LIPATNNFVLQTSSPYTSWSTVSGAYGKNLTCFANRWDNKTSPYPFIVGSDGNGGYGNVGTSNI